MSALIVLAKAPAPGRSKTRLCPPCTPEEAAALADAALTDTLRAGAASQASRHVLVLDGPPGPWAEGWEVLAQRGDGLDERLAAAFHDVGGPALLIGMDTPQVTPALIDEGLVALQAQPAVLGLAADGGFWALGLATPDEQLLLGVPMSEASTGGVLQARLAATGLGVAQLPTLRDVDHWADAVVVAAAAPHTTFAAAVATLRAHVERGSSSLGAR